jgi:multicomponent Na+:H+ antiporter subunit B
MSTHAPIIVRTLGKLLVPVIFVFAGHLAVSGAAGPGGGFVAGASAASALMLYGLVFGIEAARSAIPTMALRVLGALGLVLLLGVGVAGFARGYAFLDFHALAPAAQSALRLGAGLIQAGVMAVTASAFALAFYAIAGRVAEIGDDSW